MQTVKSGHGRKGIKSYATELGLLRFERGKVQLRT